MKAIPSHTSALRRQTLKAAMAFGLIPLSNLFLKEAFAAKKMPWVKFKKPFLEREVIPSKDGGFDAFEKVKPGHYHTGIDYTLRSPSRYLGPQILASNHGVVHAVIKNGKYDHGFGNAVILKHFMVVSSNGETEEIFTLYAHLSLIDSKIRVKQAVTLGQRIGYMGGTGNGKTKQWPVHLHFEVKTKGILENPTTPDGSKSLFFGYTPDTAKKFGYYDPNEVFDSDGWLATNYTPYR